MALRRSEIWSGVAGAVIAALIAGIFSLAPILMREADADEIRRKQISAGVAGLRKLEDPAHRLRQIEGLETLVELDEVSNYRRLLAREREAAEESIKAERAARNLRDQQDAAERARIEELRKQRELAETEAEKVRLDEVERVERQRAEQAEAAIVRLEEEERALQAAKDAAARAEEARRAANLRRIEADLLDERVCFDRNCSSWILR